MKNRRLDALHVAMSRSVQLAHYMLQPKGCCIPAMLLMHGGADQKAYLNGTSRPPGVPRQTCACDLQHNRSYDATHRTSPNSRCSSPVTPGPPSDLQLSSISPGTPAHSTDSVQPSQALLLQPAWEPCTCHACRYFTVCTFTSSLCSSQAMPRLH